MRSPPGYISASEARRIHGVDPQKLRNAASHRPHWDVITFLDGGRILPAYDLDQFLDWHWGLEIPRKERVRDCLGGCGEMSLPDRHFCSACDAQRRKRSGDPEEIMLGSLV